LPSFARTYQDFKGGRKDHSKYDDDSDFESDIELDDSVDILLRNGERSMLKQSVLKAGIESDARRKGCKKRDLLIYETTKHCTRRRHMITYYRRKEQPELRDLPASEPRHVIYYPIDPPGYANPQPIANYGGNYSKTEHRGKSDNMERFVEEAAKGVGRHLLYESIGSALGFPGMGSAFASMDQS
jgi:hypothetical protein